MNVLGRVTEMISDEKRTCGKKLEELIIRMNFLKDLTLSNQEM